MRVPFVFLGVGAIALAVAALILQERTPVHEDQLFRSLFLAGVGLVSSAAAAILAIVHAVVRRRAGESIRVSAATAAASLTVLVGTALVGAVAALGLAVIAGARAF